MGAQQETTLGRAFWTGDPGAWLHPLFPNYFASLVSAIFGLAFVGHVSLSISGMELPFVASVLDFFFPRVLMTVIILPPWWANALRLGSKRNWSAAKTKWVIVIGLWIAGTLGWLALVTELGGRMG